MGSLGSHVLVGPRALLFSLGTCDFHRTVLRVGGSLTQIGSTWIELGTGNAEFMVAAKRKSCESHQSVLH